MGFQNRLRSLVDFSNVIVILIFSTLNRHISTGILILIWFVEILIIDDSNAFVSVVLLVCSRVLSKVMLACINSKVRVLSKILLTRLMVTKGVGNLGLAQQHLAVLLDSLLKLLLHLRKFLSIILLFRDKIAQGLLFLFLQFLKLIGACLQILSHSYQLCRDLLNFLFLGFFQLSNRGLMFLFSSFSILLNLIHLFLKALYV